MTESSIRWNELVTSFTSVFGEASDSSSDQSTPQTEREELSGLYESWEIATMVASGETDPQKRAAAEKELRELEMKLPPLLRYKALSLPEFLAYRELKKTAPEDAFWHIDVYVYNKETGRIQPRYATSDVTTALDIWAESKGKPFEDMEFVFYLDRKYVKSGDTSPIPIARSKNPLAFGGEGHLSGVFDVTMHKALDREGKPIPGKLTGYTKRKQGYNYSNKFVPDNRAWAGNQAMPQPVEGDVWRVVPVAKSGNVNFSVPVEQVKSAEGTMSTIARYDILAQQHGYKLLIWASDNVNGGQLLDPVTREPVSAIRDFEYFTRNRSTELQDIKHEGRSSTGYFYGEKLYAVPLDLYEALSTQRDIILLAQTLTTEDTEIPVIDQNKAVLAELDELYTRSSQNTAKPSKMEIVDIYRQRMANAGVRTTQQLQQALHDGTIDLSIRRSDFVEDATVEQVEIDYPKTLRIGETEVPIEYNWERSKVNVSLETLLGAGDFSRFPLENRRFEFVLRTKAGLEVLVEVKKPKQLTPESIKKLVLNKVAEGIFAQFKRNASSLNESDTGQKSSLQLDPSQLSQPVEYGALEETGEKLFAYPVYTRSGSGNYVIQYYPTADAAEAAQTEFAKQQQEERKRHDEMRRKEEIRELTPVLRVKVRNLEASVKTIQGYSSEQRTALAERLRRLDSRVREYQVVPLDVYDSIDAEVKEIEVQIAEKGELLHASLLEHSTRIQELEARISGFGDMFTQDFQVLPEALQRSLQSFFEMKNGQVDPADVAEVLAALEQQLDATDPEVLKGYVDDKKGGGVFARISVKDGAVTEIDSYGDRAKTDVVVVGRSDRRASIFPDGNGVLLRPSKSFAEKAQLPEGEFAIMRDMYAIYEVELDDRGNIMQVYGKPVGYIGDEFHNPEKRTARLQKEAQKRIQRRLLQSLSTKKNASEGSQGLDVSAIEPESQQNIAGGVNNTANLHEPAAQTAVPEEKTLSPRQMRIQELREQGYSDFAAAVQVEREEIEQKKKKKKK